MAVPQLSEAPAPGPAPGNRPIAVIGAGFSGTIATLQLLKRLPTDQPVLLCERSAEFARGVAYATGDDDHLLNVRASNMSALTDDPLHFQDWLKRRTADGTASAGTFATEAGLFATRGLYSQYLRSVMDYAMRETASHAQLRLLPCDVLDIVSAEGGGYELVCADAQRVPVAGAVIAVGNMLPEESEDPHICRNPWGEKAWRPLAPDQPVLIIGTGLTMVDAAVALHKRGFEGGIIAMSRGGLLPTRHTPSRQWPTPNLTMAEEVSLPLLMARLREEVAAAADQGIDWRAVIDSMRPITAKLWGRLPLAERRRFLRHARRYWDVHRHRMAPPHAAIIDDMLRAGALQVTAGTVRGFASTRESVRVSYVPRGTTGLRELEVQRVIFASGVENISSTRDPLMQRLLDRGLVRMDSQGLGLDVTDGLNIVRGDDTVAERLWALGPIVRGVFWECVAVPDIRVQAAHMAVSVVARLREDAPRWNFII
jgi:uncharacterized NAD(P)/FAD-binding protein YdhS